MSQVNTEEDKDNVDRQDYKTQHMESWLGHLMNYIAKNNMCHLIVGKGYEQGQRVGNSFRAGRDVRHFYLFGKRANLDVVEYLYTYLADEIERLTPKGKPTKYKTAFKMGAVQTVGKRMAEELRNFQSTPETTSLIVVNDAALQTRVNNDFPDLRHGRRTTIGDYNAYRDGQAAGNSIQFRQGVGNKNSAGQGLIGG